VITSEPLGWISNSIESEMALFSECRLKCAQNTLDIADIVREGIYQELPREDQPSGRHRLIGVESPGGGLCCNLLGKFDMTPAHRRRVELHGRTNGTICKRRMGSIPQLLPDEFLRADEDSSA